MWVQGVMDGPHNIYKALSKRPEYHKLAKVRDEFNTSPKIPIAKTFVNTHSGGYLVIAPLPHWADYAEEPTEYTWRWGVFYWDGTAPSTHQNTQESSLVNVTQTFRTPSRNQPWSAAKPEELLGPVARFVQQTQAVAPRQGKQHRTDPVLLCDPATQPPLVVAGL